MGKIDKLLILLFWGILAIFMVPAILPMIVGEAAWILVPVLIIFVIVFPILVVMFKEEKG